MGCVKTITHDKFPKQRDENYKYPFMGVGKRVEVCFHYDISKYCMGTIVRSDIEEPFEEIIRLDDGRYVRAAECQYSYVDEESEETTMKHNATITTKEEKTVEEFWKLIPYPIIRALTPKEYTHEPTIEEIAQFLSDTKANFVTVSHNYRFAKGE